MGLTRSQKLWMLRQNIKVGNIYMIPQWGFNFYMSPNDEPKMLDLNPFTRSLGFEELVVKGIEGEFCKVNFKNQPYHIDFYILRDELSARPLLISALLFITCSIPMLIYNLFGS